MDKHALTASYGLSLKLKKCKQKRDSMEEDMASQTGREHYCAKLNEHEKEVMKVLEINPIKEDELRECIECHKKLWHDDEELQDKPPWLFTQVLISINQL